MQSSCKCLFTGGARADGRQFCTIERVEVHSTERRDVYNGDEREHNYQLWFIPDRAGTGFAYHMRPFPPGSGRAHSAVTLRLRPATRQGKTAPPQLTLTRSSALDFLSRATACRQVLGDGRGA